MYMLFLNFKMKENELIYVLLYQKKREVFLVQNKNKIKDRKGINKRICFNIKQGFS